MLSAQSHQILKEFFWHGRIELPRWFVKCVRLVRMYCKYIYMYNEWLYFRSDLYRGDFLHNFSPMISFTWTYQNTAIELSSLLVDNKILSVSLSNNFSGTPLIRRPFTGRDQFECILKNTSGSCRLSDWPYSVIYRQSPIYNLSRQRYTPIDIHEFILDSGTVANNMYTENASIKFLQWFLIYGTLYLKMDCLFSTNSTIFYTLVGEPN